MSHALRALTLAIAVLALATPARAEIIVKNDSMPPNGVPVFGLPVGSRIGAWLDTPIDGTIVGVQILWGSTTGGTAPSHEGPIRISTFDTATRLPGTTLATIDSPVLQDGVLNEFRHLDAATNLLPLAVPITAGQSFFIDLQIATDYLSSSTGPGVLSDTDGESFPIRNYAQFAGSTNPTGWFPVIIAVLDGGDLGIRAIIQPVPEPSTYIMAMIGIVALLALGRRKLSA
jgi:hypothetical protein